MPVVRDTILSVWQRAEPTTANATRSFALFSIR